MGKKKQRRKKKNRKIAESKENNWELEPKMPDSTPERRRELYKKWERNELNQIPADYEKVHEILPEEFPEQVKKKEKEKIISDGKGGIIFVHDE